MFINIPPLTKYIRELTEYQILIFGVQPNIELFGEYIWSNRILNYSVATLENMHFSNLKIPYFYSSYPRTRTNRRNFNLGEFPSIPIEMYWRGVKNVTYL